MSHALYEQFINHVGSIVAAQNLTGFKSHPSVTYMLEHVTFSLGQEYLSYLRQLTPLSEQKMMAYCEANDRIGGGEKHDYGFIRTSPSNFRYLLHAHLILTHAIRNGLSSLRIVEVGCGYGGLCLAITQLAPMYRITIETYHLVDLPEISALQKLYLSEHAVHSLPVRFHSAETYGENIQDRDLFLVSNYCFSEIDAAHQKKYIQHLFPKVSHGFMTWNHIPLYDFGFSVRSEREFPMTGGSQDPQTMNRYVYF